MPNKLKDVFSNKMFDLGSSLHFQDMEAKNEFINALKIVQDEGRTVKLNGVSSISTSVKDGDIVYPFMVESELTHVVIAPSINIVPMTFNTSYGKKTVNFQRYETSSEVIVETGKNEIVFFKFAFTKGAHNVNFTYRMQSQFAKKSKDVAESYCSALGILNHLFKPNKELATTESLETINKIKQSFQITYSFWKKLSLIEDELNMSFAPIQIGSIDDNVLDVEDLYLFLVEKKAVRLDAKLTSTETMGIIFESGAQIPDIGKPINITFTGKTTYSICDQSIVIYTANLLTNAIVKEIVKNENSAKKILYGDTESMPMYISCTGFKTPEEADIEHNLIMNIKGLKEKYLGALTATEHLKQENLA